MRGWGIRALTSGSVLLRESVSRLGVRPRWPRSAVGVPRRCLSRADPLLHTMTASADVRRQKVNMAAMGRLAAVSIGGLCALFPLPGSHGFHVAIRTGLCHPHGRCAGSAIAPLRPHAGATGGGPAPQYWGRGPGAPGRSQWAPPRAVLSMSASGAGGEALLTTAEIDAMTVPQMKKALKARGLSSTGKAVELKERLLEECTAEGIAAGGRSGASEPPFAFKNKSGGGAVRKPASTARPAGEGGAEYTGTTKVLTPPELDVMDVEEMATVTELVAALRKRGLSTEGSFDELQDRLIARVIEEEEAYDVASEAEYRRASEALQVTEAAEVSEEREGGGEGGRGGGKETSAAAVDAFEEEFKKKWAAAAEPADAAGVRGSAEDAGEWDGESGAWAYVEVEDVPDMALVKKKLKKKARRGRMW